MKRNLIFLLSLFLSLGAFAIQTGEWYAIKSGTKALFIKDASMANGADVILWTTTNVPAQLWTIVENEDRTISLQSAYDEKYLCSQVTPKAGAKIVARSSSVQRLGCWALNPVEGKADTYNIVSKDGAFMISASENSDAIQPTLVDATAPSGKVEWKFVKYSGNVSTQYDSAARDQIVDGFMSQYYHSTSSGHVFGNGGFWGDAEMIETILDGFETTGLKTYQTYATELLKDFLSRNGSDWTRTGQGWPKYNEYNDDITWICLALLRSYKYFKNTNHLNVARDNFDKMWARAYQQGGTLRWSQNAAARGSNSCINCPAIIACCYLYELTGEEDYLTKAKNLWEAQYNTLCDKNDGHVWDSGEWNESFTKFTVGNYWGSTYNQGTMLGACIKLYMITGENKYKNYADKVYNWSYSSLTANTQAQPHIINACQTAVGDLCGFKGILVRYARMYAEDLNHKNTLEWLQTNAWYAMQNANSKGVIWSKWLTKTPEDFKSQEGNEVKDFRNDAFGSSTAVSCALNAHVNAVFSKNPYATIGCEQMDDMQWVQIDNSQSDGDTPNTTRAVNGAWMCFKNVNFGSDGANSVMLRVKGSENVEWSVYIDNPKEENLIATTGPLTSGWADVAVNTLRPVTGTHRLYVMNTGTTGGYFHNIIFSNTTADGIEMPATDTPTVSDAIYNISGQKVDASYKGIVIKNGRKILKK